MILAFDAKRAFANNTGLGNYSRMVIGGFAKLHPEVTLVLFTPSRKGRYADCFDGYPQVRIVTPRGLWRLCPSLWRTVAAGFIARRLHVDLYHGLSHELPLFLPRSVRRVVTIHDLIAWRYPHQFHAIDRIIYHLKFRHACYHADKVVCVSRQTERDAVDLLHADPAKTLVIYQSCDPIFQQPVDTDHCRQVRQRYRLPERYILCVGTIEERKNQITAVRSLALLPPDIHLVIVGRRTPYFDQVKQAVEQLQLVERVHFLHNADFADFPALYAAAEASVYPSIFEGFGIPVLESLCCGTPVVAARSSSLPEVGGNAALYAEPDNAEDFADQLRRILDEAPLRQKLIAAAADQCRQFCPEAIVQSLLTLYESILKQS